MMMGNFAIGCGVMVVAGSLNLETAVNRFPARETYLFSSTCGHARLHLLGEIATHPIEPRWAHLADLADLAALLLQAGMSPPRRRALPKRPIAAHSGASNCRF
jgi:hypothetical protein